MWKKICGEEKIWREVRGQAGHSRVLRNIEVNPDERILYSIKLSKTKILGSRPNMSRLTKEIGTYIHPQHPPRNQTGPGLLYRE